MGFQPWPCYGYNLYYQFICSSVISLMQIRLSRIHYAWVIIGLSVLLYLGGGSITQAFGVVIVPLQDQYGWNQGAITVAYSISAIMSAVMSPYVGMATDKYGEIGRVHV